MLRLSSLLLAAAVFVPAVASARRVHSAVSNVATVAAPAAPVAEVAEAAADSEQLGFSGKCAAKCAIDAAMCVHGCGKKSSLEAAQLTLTCKEECALKATACAAKCVLSADVSLPAVEGVESDLIDGSNIEAAFAEINNSPDALMLGQFQSFKAQFGKKYASEEVEAHRFELFKQNMARAEELNKLNPTAKFGVTQFSDLHPSEFKRQYLTYRPAVGDSAVLRKAAPVMEASNVSAVPDNWDWRRPSDGRPVGVTAVKDQGQCGSCWAFSATEATESAWILAGNSPQILAPEQTVDCDTTDGGCNGGDTVTAYAYIKQTGGIMAESAYPYKAGVTGVAGKCKFERSGVKASIKGFEYATPGCDDECDKQNEEQLKENLYKVGPVSICVDAEPWQMYQSGILGTGSGCTKAYDTLDHCVQLVGYGVDAATKEAFWSVRNSWATSWGEAGYIRLKYGVNLCGVADEATIVQV